MPSPPPMATHLVHARIREAASVIADRFSTRPGVAAFATTVLADDDAHPSAQEEIDIRDVVFGCRAIRDEVLHIASSRGDSLSASELGDLLRWFDGATARAISTMSRSEASLRADAKHLHALVDAVPDHLGVLTLDGEPLEGNRALRESAKEMFGVDFFDREVIAAAQAIMLQAPRNGHDPALNLARVSAGETVVAEVKMPTKAGERWHEYKLAPVYSEDRTTVEAAVLCTRDIDAHKRTAERLEEALLSRERVIGILGHDLKNPLHALQLSAHLLASSVETSAVAFKNVQRITRAAARMSGIIESVLEASEAKHRRVIPAFARADASVIVAEVIDELSLVHGPDAVIFESEGNPDGEWDAPKLGQLISNLVGNALVHGDRRHPVLVSLVGEVSSVVISVHNRGPSIAPELHEEIFEPFRRGARFEDPDRPVRGLGLGLYIAQQIVLAHAGTIELDSSGPAGTTFTVTLPRTPPLAVRSQRATEGAATR